MVHLSGVLWSESGQRPGHLEMAFMWAGFIYSPGGQELTSVLTLKSSWKDRVTECSGFPTGGDKDLGGLWLAGEALLP